jgi:hypothetical protein
MMFAFSGVGKQTQVTVYNSFNLLSELGGYMSSIFSIALFFMSRYNRSCLKFNIINKFRI